MSFNMSTSLIANDQETFWGDRPNFTPPSPVQEIIFNILQGIQRPSSEKANDETVPAIEDTVNQDVFCVLVFITARSVFR